MSGVVIDMTLAKARAFKPADLRICQPRLEFTEPDSNGHFRYAIVHYRNESGDAQDQVFMGPGVHRLVRMNNAIDALSDPLDRMMYREIFLIALVIGRTC